MIICGILILFSFLSLIFCLRIHTSEEWKIEMTVLRPFNFSIVGETAHLRIQFINTSTYINNEGRYLTLRNNIVQNMSLAISMNDLRLASTRYDIDSSIHESTLCKGVFQSGRNDLSLIVYSQISGKKIANVHMELYSSFPIDDNLDGLIRMSDYNRLNMKQYAYMLIGLDASTLERLILLEARRWELFYPTQTFWSQNWSINQLYTHASIESLDTVGFIDHSCINISALANFNFSKEYLISIIHSTLVRTRSSILLFMDSASIPILKEIIEKQFHFEQIFFNKREFRRGVEVVLKDAFLDSHSGNQVWYRQQKLKDFSGEEANLSDGNDSCGSPCVEDDEGFAGRVLTVNNNDDRTHLVFESYAWGRSHILFKNVCMAPRSWVEQQQRRRPLQQAQNLPPEDLVILTNSDRPLLNITFLSEEEENGFLYTGLHIMDVRDVLFPYTFRQNVRSWPRVRGMTAVTFSVQGGHIVHETEPFAQFLSAIQLLQDANTSNSCEPDSLQYHYQYIGRKLRRILFAKMTSDSANDWVLKMVNLIFSFYNLSVRMRCGVSNGMNRIRDSPAIFVRDHFYPERDYQDGSGPPVLCYEELLLLGRATTHTGYFSSSNIAAEFKQFVYNKFSIGSTMTSMVEKIAFRTGKRQLRITIALRTGPERLIMNLPELLQLMVSLRQSLLSPLLPFPCTLVILSLSILLLIYLTRGREADGKMKNNLLVDEEWLLSHISPFDGLSFQEQATLMAETDVLISVHSAALFNGIFLKPGSAAINIMNGRFIEYVFSPPLRYSLSCFLSLSNTLNC